MEHRRVERFSMRLPVEVCDAAGSPCRGATVRDISSRGVSFYSAGAWPPGAALRMAISFDEEVAGPYPYQLHVQGRVVRAAKDDRTGREYHAVSFTDPGTVRDWRENPAEGRR